MPHRYSPPFRADADDCSAKQLQALVRLGVLAQPFRGVFVGASLPDTLDLRAAALALLTPPDAVACRRTAAWLHGVDANAVNAHLVPPVPEVVVPAGRAATRRDGVHGYSALLAPDDVTAVGGVAVTTPLRTAVDCARWLPPDDAVAAVDALLHVGLVDLDELRAAVGRLFRVPGKLQAVRVVAVAEAKAESPMESRMRWRIVSAGLPRPVAQFEVRDGDVVRYRLDLAYPDRLLAIEYDGEAYHGPEQRAADEARRAWLRARG